MDARPLLIAIAVCAAMAVLGARLSGGSWRPWHSALRKPRLSAPLPAFAVVGVAVAGGQKTTLRQKIVLSAANWLLFSP
jgi:hypothetical protein